MAKRQLVPRTRANNTLTEAGFKQFIIQGLRKKSMFWKPISVAKRNARHHVKLPNGRGKPVFHSRCARCDALVPETTSKVDHIEPVVDPHVGFTNWDDYINRMFCEVDGLQVLCGPCHDLKTKAERQIATERKRREREQD